jgi:hypothetical protein
VKARARLALRGRWAWGLAAGLYSLCTLCAAASLRYCDGPADVSAAQQDRLFRFAAVIKGELESSGQEVALVSRAGLELQRFGQRYSHAGWALKHNPQTPWAVRQLYFSCEEKQSRLFDQGLSAFLVGAANPDLGFVSVIMLPPSQAAQLEALVLDKQRALQLLSPHYSANAFAFSSMFQNCNQWVAEVLATALGGAVGGAVGGELGTSFQKDSDPSSPRQQAQAWLQAQAYAPTVFDVGWPLMWVSTLIPWLQQEDHPQADLQARQYRVSMPASIEAFVRQQWPQTQRIEFCQTPTHVLVRRGWGRLPNDCQASDGDTVISFN